MRYAAEIKTHGTLNLHDNFLSGCNILILGGKSNLSALGESRDGEEGN